MTTYDQMVNELLNMCKGRGFIANLSEMTDITLELFGCKTSAEFRDEILGTLQVLKTIPALDSQVFAIECALGLDGGTPTILTNRRFELSCAESVSERTIMRNEKKGAEYIISVINRTRSTHLSSVKS